MDDRPIQPKQKHVLTPLPPGATFGIIRCTCGALWRVWLSPRGQIRVAINSAAEHTCPYAEYDATQQHEPKTA